MSADAHHITAPHPEGLGATNVMLATLEDAGMKPEEVDYVNVHGTSTPLGDVAEAQAIQRVFDDNAYNLSISSTKSMTGHLLGAAGAVEAMASILAIKHNIVPPTINFEHKDENLDPNLDFTFNKAREREVGAALSNTSALEVTTHRCCSRNSLNYMGILNRLFRRDDRTGEIDVLIKTHFNLRIKKRDLLRRSFEAFFSSRWR